MRGSEGLECKKEERYKRQSGYHGPLQLSSKWKSHTDWCWTQYRRLDWVSWFSQRSPGGCSYCNGRMGDSGGWFASPNSSQESILIRADHFTGTKSNMTPTYCDARSCDSGNQRQEHNPASFLYLHYTKSRRSSRTFSDRIIQFRQRQKSMILEVFTPDDMQDVVTETRANSQNRSLR